MPGAYPGLMLENNALLFPLGMIVARIPAGEDDSIGEQTWRIDYSAGNTLWGEEYFAEVDDNSAGDTIVMLEVLIDSAGGKKTLPRTIFSWLLAEDNPIISW